MYYIAAVDRELNGNNEGAIMILVLMITEFVDYLNLGKNMAPHQIKQTAELILSDVSTRNLKPEHFKVCFDRMKKGYYGKFYDRMDGSIIFECLHLYCGELADFIESENIKKSSQEQGDKRSIGISPELLPVMKQALKELPKEPQKPYKTGLWADSKISALFDEFDKEWMNGSDKIEKYGRRFIMVNDRPVSRDKWVEIKLSEQFLKDNEL